jgi:uncharacterized membrane protein HdeD (DUF308 family)
MKLTYETGTATLVQFMVLGILNLLTGLNSIISACHSGKDCMTNAIVTPIYYILVTGWFASLWVLGYFAQERRSKWLARLLFCAEGLVALVALYNTKQHIDFIGLVTSLADLVLALWIMFLTVRLMLAGPNRVVSHKRGMGRNRPRQRRT